MYPESVWVETTGFVRKLCVTLRLVEHATEPDLSERGLGSAVREHPRISNRRRRDFNLEFPRWILNQTASKGGHVVATGLKINFTIDIRRFYYRPQFCRLYALLTFNGWW